MEVRDQILEVRSTLKSTSHFILAYLYFSFDRKYYVIWKLTKFYKNVDPIEIDKFM